MTAIETGTDAVTQGQPAWRPFAEASLRKPLSGTCRPEERVQLDLHRTLLAKLLADSEAVLEVGRRGIVRMQDSVRGAQAQRWLDEWQVMLDEPGPGLVQAFTGSDEHSVDLRQVSPFAGVSPSRSAWRPSSGRGR